MPATWCGRCGYQNIMQPRRAVEYLAVGCGVGSAGTWAFFSLLAHGRSPHVSTLAKPTTVFNPNDTTVSPCATSAFRRSFRVCCCSSSSSFALPLASCCDSSVPVPCLPSFPRPLAPHGSWLTPHGSDVAICRTKRLRCIVSKSKRWFLRCGRLVRAKGFPTSMKQHPLCEKTRTCSSRDDHG